MSRPGNKVEGLKQSLLRLDEFVRSKSPSFQIFNSSAYGGKDLLFKDSSVTLIDVKEKNSTEAWLGQKYFDALRSLSLCQEVVAAPRSLTVKLKSMNTGQLLLIELITVVCCLFQYAIWLKTEESLLVQGVRRIWHVQLNSFPYIQEDEAMSPQIRKK